MFDRIVRFVEILLMVNEDTPVAQRQWRMVVALCILGFSLHIVWACGWLDYFGIPGFAQSRELIAIKQRLDAAAADSSRIQERLLQKSIIDVRIQQCNATAKRFYTDHMRELTDEYYATNHRVFDLPDCKDLN